MWQICMSETAFSHFKQAVLTGPYFDPQASQGTHKWSARSMTSTEEVQHIPCSVGARQAEPPAPQKGACTSSHEAELSCNGP